jgi:hypothetical protein
VWSGEWKHDVRFQKWLRESLDRTSAENWPLILLRHEQLAINGSVRSAEFILKVRTLAHSAAPDGAAFDECNPPYTVQLLVPRPPQLPENT